MTAVETKIQDAVLTAIENLAIPIIQLAMQSINASSGRGVDSVVLNTDRIAFERNIEGLQMTTWSRINSHIDLHRIDETLGSITVEGDDLTVKEKTLANWHTLITAAELT